MNRDEESIVSEAESLFDHGEFDRCKELLEPLVKAGHAKATRLFYSIDLCLSQIFFIPKEKHDTKIKFRVNGRLQSMDEQKHLSCCI